MANLDTAPDAPTTPAAGESSRPTRTPRQRQREVIPANQRLAVDAIDGGSLIGISRREFLQWDASGTLGPVAVIRKGRVVRWDRAELIAWWQACCPPRTKWQVIRDKFGKFPSACKG